MQAPREEEGHGGTEETTNVNYTDVQAEKDRL